MNATLLELLRGIGRYVPNSIYWRVTPLLLENAFGAVDRKPARHFVDIWERHYGKAQGNGLSPPTVVVEIGPGDAMGVGLCSILAGAKRCIGLDEIEHANDRRNAELFEDLVRELGPLTHSSELVDATRLAIHGQQNSLGIVVSYSAPMSSAAGIEDATVDFLISNAVMEHVENIYDTYQTCARILKPGGVMSHEIDFRCHGTANRWNGHWTYDRDVWQKIRGNRSYLLNRLPYSAQVKAIENLPFEILSAEVSRRDDGVRREELAREFAGLSDDDLSTSIALIQARRL